MIPELHTEEYNPLYTTILEKVDYDSIVEGLEKSKKDFFEFAETIPEEKWHYAYASNKWTIIEVLLHIIDAERIYAYRALCFARNDKTSIPTFDENNYVLFSNAHTRSKEDLIANFESVRNDSISLFRSFTDQMLQRIGVVNDSPLSAKAVGYIMVGHQKHHIEIIKERYL